MVSKRSFLRSETTISYTPSYYGITISKHQKKDYVGKSDIDGVLTALQAIVKTMDVILSAYENSGKYSQLHFHGIVKVNEWFKYKKLSSINGFSVHWEQLKSAAKYRAAVKYITKECYNEYSKDNILIENYYINNYGFDDDKMDGVAETDAQSLGNKQLLNS